MSTPIDDPDLVTPVPGSMPLPTVNATTLAEASAVPPEDLPKVNARYIWLMVLAQFGVWVAFITPIAISLAVRVGQLAPGHEEYLGYITGAGALAVMLTSPLFGTLSDRTRTRLGRRRPWMIGGMILGVVSLVVMALAPSVLWLGFGWILAQLGWGQTLTNLQTSTADRLPESQRGKVAGLIGFSTQIAPVIGVIIASSFTRENLQLFLIPGAVGVILVTLFLVLIHEDDSRGRVFDAPLSFGGLFRKYVYSPKQFPDFSWNWLGRFLFYFGLTLNTTFTAFFFASRLHVDIADVGGIIAALAGAGVLATTAGALGGGFLSDRLHRRRIFVLIGAILFAGRRDGFRPVAAHHRRGIGTGLDGHRHLRRGRSGPASGCPARERDRRRRLHGDHGLRDLHSSGLPFIRSWRPRSC